jgi:hypothetical protein
LAVGCRELDQANKKLYDEPGSYGDAEVNRVAHGDEQGPPFYENPAQLAG